MIKSLKATKRSKGSKESGDFGNLPEYEIDLLLKKKSK